MHICIQKFQNKYFNTHTKPTEICNDKLLRDFSFRREVDEKRALLGYYVVSIGNSLPKFWDNLSVPSSRVKNPGQ
jgi:hypothetical protein